MIRALGKLGRLRAHFRRHPGKLVGGLLAIAAAVGLALLAPLIIGRAVDEFVRTTSPATLLAYGAALVAVTAVQGVFGFAQRMILVSLSRDIEYELRNDYFEHLERMPLSFYQERYTGDLMARATNDLQAVRMLCGPAIMYSTSTVLTAAGALLFMVRIDWRLTVLALSSMPLVALTTQVFGQRIHHLFEEVQEQFAALSTRVQENLAGARVVRAHAMEDSELARFDGINEIYVERNTRLIRWTAAFHPLLQLLVGVGFVAVLVYGGRLVLTDRISVGEFVSFQFFLAMLVWPMIAIGWVINLVQRGSASMGRIEEILTTPPAIADDPESVAGVELSSTSLAVRDLSFSYPDATEPALQGISFELASGGTLGIVGRTGSGKSTLLSTLVRLVDPPRGAVFVGGADVRSIPLASLRSACAVVPQEAFLFSTTVAANVAMGGSAVRAAPGSVGSDGPDDAPAPVAAGVARAVELAGLAADLEFLPQGLETVVGERGVTLSGGQKQRVALARALIREPRLLLLDDCLSAVDADTEEMILSNLRSVFAGRTVVVVSHRVSAVRAADRILVLDAGRIAESGDHDTLLAAGGVYAELARRQELEAELEAV